MTGWRRISLRSQLSVVVGVVLAALLAILGTVLCLTLRQVLYHQAERQLQMAAMASKPAMQWSSKAGPLLELVPPLGISKADLAAAPMHDVMMAAPITKPIRERLHVLADTLTDNRMSALIVAPDGSELARGDRAYRFDLPSPPAVRQDIVQLLAEREEHQATIVTEGGERQLTMVVPLHDPDGALIGALQLASPTRDIDAVVQGFFWFVVWSTAITLIVGIGLCAFASERVLRPLQRIVEASREVAEGNYAMRLALPVGNEVGRLGDAFDHMVARTAEAFAAQQRFVADAAHELRTPLTAIGGSIEMLQIGAVDHQPEKRRRLLQNIGGEVDRLGRLANDLLLLSSLEQRPRVLRGVCDLQPLLSELVEQTRLIAPDLQIDTALPVALPVLGDRDQLYQVFLNILTNARTYTPAGGSITITAVAGDHIVVHIADTGIGIPAEALPHIWERLYRADRSRSRTAGGSGLGLAIVRTIVEAHKGSVSAISEPGKGTVISISLPCHPPRLNLRMEPLTNP